MAPRFAIDRNAFPPRMTGLLAGAEKGPGANVPATRAPCRIGPAQGVLDCVS